MAEREIKTTLALDGEKQFKAAMDEAFRGLKVLGSEMKLNTAIFGDNASSMEGLTKKGEILQKQIAQQKEIVAALTKAVEESAAAYGENDKRTDAYRIKLNNASAALNNMEGDLKDNQSAIDNFGKKTQDADKKTVNWTATLKKAGDVLGKTVAVAAKATAAAVAAVGTAAAVAAKKIFDATKSAGEFADNLITLSNQTGISTDTLQKWDYASRFVDVSVETMTGSMAKMVKQMDAVYRGSEDCENAFGELDVRIADANGLRDSEAVFADVIDALGKMSNETERDAMAMRIFGKSAQDLNPLIKAGGDELKKLGQEAVNMGLVLDAQSVGALGTFDDTMQRIQAQTEGLSRTLAVQFLPAVSGVMTGVQEVLGGIGAVLKDGFQPEDVKAIGDMIAQKLIEGINAISAYLPSVIETVSGMLTQLVGVLVSILPTLLQPLMEGATQLLTGLMTAISSNIEPIAVAATMIIIQFVNFLTTNLPTIISMGINMLLELVRGITFAIPQIVPAAVGCVMAMVQGIVGALPQIVKAGIELVVALVKGLIDSIPKIIDAIPDLIQSIVETVTANLPIIIKAGIELTIALIAGIIKAIPQLIGAMPQIIAGVVSGLMAGIGAIWDVGVNMVRGIWEGIKSATTWLWEKLKGWVHDTLGWIAGLLGISSPSKVMRDYIGVNMGKGMAEGIEASGKYVDKAMSGIIPDTRSTSLALDVTRRFNDVASDAMNITRRVQTNQTMDLSESALDKLAAKIGRQIEKLPAPVVEFEGREVARMNRKVALA